MSLEPWQPPAIPIQTKRHLVRCPFTQEEDIARIGVVDRTADRRLPDGDAVNPVTQDAYVYPVTVDLGDALDLRYYSFWKGHWYNQSPFPMDHLVTAWLPRPGVFEDGRDRGEIVHSVVVGSTSYWKIKDRNDPVDAVCNNCRYTIPLTEVVPEKEEDTKDE